MGLGLKKNIHRWLGKRLLRKIENDRVFELKGLQIEIDSGVFHPKYFNSSQLLLDWVESQDLKNKSLLELGCGSGVVAMLAARKGARVTASDISEKVIRNLRRNAEKNKLELTIIKSDLMDNIPELCFDFILINPPFYPKNPTDEDTYAWYCGENFDYFQKLFGQLKEKNFSGEVILSLSQDCDFESIKGIFSDFGFFYKKTQVKKSYWEKNYLFKLFPETEGECFPEESYTKPDGL